MNPNTFQKLNSDSFSRAKLDLDDLEKQSSNLAHPAIQDIKSASVGNSEIKSISHLNSKKYFGRTKTEDIYNFFPLKNELNLPPESKQSKQEKKVMEHVDLSFQKLVKFPFENYPQFDQIYDLNLSYNEIYDFPPEILSLLNLVVLKLDHNKIGHLPNDIYKLKNLEFFSISNNKLTSLPTTLKNLRNLKNLNIGKNYIKVLSYEVTNIESLETLYIYGNIFESFPVSFRNLQNLKEFAFEWLNYTNPPIESILKRPMHNHVFDRVNQLCTEIANLRLSSISFITFLQSLSLDPIDFTKPDIKTRNLMHLAAIKDELSILVNMGREYPELINQIDKENQTPLTLSLLENKSRSVQCLLGIGADPRKGGGQLGSSLHLATFKLDSKTTEIFLKAGCDPNGTDYDKNTPLHLVFSIFSKNEEESKIISELLLKYGADPNLKNKDLWTPLHLAVKRSQIKAVMWAIECNKKNSSNEEMSSQEKKKSQFFNFNRKGGQNLLTPMHLAIHNGSLQLIEKLGENNVNMFIENSNLQLPRHLSYHSLLVVKTTRKLEMMWIRRNIINKNQRLLVQPTFEMKMGEIKSRLGGQDEGRHEIEDGVIDSEVVVIDEMADEDELEIMEEFTAKHNEIKSSDLFKRNVKGENNANIIELNTKQNNSNKNCDLILKATNKMLTFPKNGFFIIQNESMLNNLKNINLQSLILEIEKFPSFISDEEVAFSEKLRHIWYMKLFQYEIDGSFYKLKSAYLPWYVYILHEVFKYKKKERFYHVHDNILIIELLTKIFNEIFQRIDKEPTLERKEKSKDNECFDDYALKFLEREEDLRILEEILRIFAEFCWKKGKTLIKKILKTSQIKAKLLQYESIQLLLHLIYYKSLSEVKREKSLPVKQNAAIKERNDISVEKIESSMKKYQNGINFEMKNKFENELRRNIGEEIPIKSGKNVSSQEMASKNPFSKKLKKRNENLNDEEGNDCMELHIEKYFPSKMFISPFKNN